MTRHDPMRLVYIATGDIALPAFNWLLDNGPRPLALVTQPDKPAGRHQDLMPPAVKLAAHAAGIPVMQPELIGDAAGELAALAPDVIVVIAYGQILRQPVLTIARQAVINLHASLLPRHRGASCIQAAIDAGDAESGVTAMHVTRGLDAGDIIFAKSIPVGVDETAGSLHDRLAELASEVLAVTLQRLADGSATRTPQDPDLVTHAPKLERTAGRIDWSLDAGTLERRIRAYDPWPGTYTTVREAGLSKRLKIFPPVEVSGCDLGAGVVACEDGVLRVGCGIGSLVLQQVQPDGARRMGALEYLRGHHPDGVE